MRAKKKFFESLSLAQIDTASQLPALLSIKEAEDWAGMCPIKKSEEGGRPLRLSRRLVIFSAYLKVSLWMTADRTNLRCAGSHHNVSAIAAFPNLYFTLFKYLCRLQIM